MKDRPMYISPAEIETRSMAIIDGELRARGVEPPEENAAVIRRVVHTTADFDYAENLFFSEHAVRRGIAALRKGTPIVTDTNMAKAGVSRPGLERLGGQVFCYMADEDVAAAARAAGTTRAAAAVQKAVREHANAVYAVGNAPTALFALAERIESGLRPGLVIAVPVGFVNVVEGKERITACCEEHDVPVIAARGRKGGSGVAAAICNALLYSAAGMLDPCRRDGSTVPNAENP